MEYTDGLVTCELAMLIAAKYNEPVDNVVRATAHRVYMRCNNQQNRNVFLEISQNEHPAALLYQFRTLYDKALSKK